MSVPIHYFQVDSPGCLWAECQPKGIRGLCNGLGTGPVVGPVSLPSWGCFFFACSPGKPGGRGTAHRHVLLQLGHPSVVEGFVFFPGPG